MKSVSAIILEIVCPALGTIIGNVMFSAPYKDVKNAISKGMLGDLNPTPWAFMLGNCCGWVTYSILIQNLWVFVGNAPGLILSVWLNMGAVKLQYQEHHKSEMRQSIVHFMERSQHKSKLTDTSPSVSDDVEGSAARNEDAENPSPNSIDFETLVNDVTSKNSAAPAPHETITMVLVIIWVAAIALVSFSSDSLSLSTRQLVVGVLVNLNLVFFYGAPLSTIVTVVKTRNSASIHVWTMITNTANGLFWGAYGLALLDPFIYVPNGIGAGLGVIQMFLCMTFPRKPISESDNPDEQK